jgi:hypothetical protein
MIISIVALLEAKINGSSSKMDIGLVDNVAARTHIPRLEVSC